MSFSRRHAVFALPALAWSAISSRVGAQASLPPITLVVPYAQGGTADRIGRLTATKLALLLRQTVNVLNIVGGSGVTGTDFMAAAPPNGSTIGLAVSTPIVAATLLRRQKAYDVFRDFDWISVIGTYANAMVVPASAPSTLDAWLRAARMSPAPVRYGTAGVGSSGHFAGEFLRFEQQANLLHVPFDIMSDAYAELDAGQVAAIFDGVPNAAANVSANRRLLAVTSERRQVSLPDVPAFGETWAEQNFVVWSGIVVPPRLPAQMRERLRKAMAEVHADPSYVARLRELGVEVVGLQGRQALLYVEDDFIRQARLIARIRTDSRN
jgi:tripartite-type tricarboxylate transporter receptor subunit TctC